MPIASPHRDSDDFSLVLGGPLYQFYLRTRLARPPLLLLKRRIAALTMLAWLPLLILTAFAGTLSSGVSFPFLHDLDVHARLLISLTLLMVAEPFVHLSLSLVLRQLVERDLILAEDRARFEQAIASTVRLRNSVLVEIILLAIAVFSGFWLGVGDTTGAGLMQDNPMQENIDTWYGRTTADGVDLTAAGKWYVFFSMPLFRFLLLRWYFRLALWYRLLWVASRLNLQLNALHPDRAGGISFLGISVFAFAPIFIAQTVLASAVIGDNILHKGAELLAFKWDIVAIAVILLLIALLPLSFFMGQMSRAKRMGLRDYGTQASHYVNAFRDKWLSGNSDPSNSDPSNSDPSKSDTAEPFLGSADIQSLADLAGSYEGVTTMRLFPIGGKALGLFAIVIIAPFLPLVLTMIPLKEVVSRLVQIVL